ncbi:MAG: GH36-type glycosyl hydrolase domain-containing protein, partial [Candidatus Spyradocola sp.]
VTAVSDDPLRVPGREAMATVDAYPPALFLQGISEDVALSGDETGLAARAGFALEPHQEKRLQLIIGYAFGNGVSTQEAICGELRTGSMPEKCSAFAADWDNVLPRFEGEADETLRRELRWHLYNLEAMATYSEYYGETKIPQGTIYDYDWGCHASARDNFQHALPLVYADPALAKSVLRYMLERTTPFGEIRLIEYGNGHADNERYFTSDQQLYFLLLLTEYLRVTKDYALLAERVQPYPVRGMAEMTVAALTEQCFTFLRDTIGTGEHGLVKLLNSDWNDAVYYIEKVPYNNIFFTGESHMNSAMAIAILQSLIPQLEAAAGALPEEAEQLRRLSASMALYRRGMLDAFLRDMGDRAFPRRMYFNGKPYGDDNMFLEPQGFTLQIAELSGDRKRRLYEEMRRRVYPGETLGAREQQAPEFEDPGFDKGSRENGGFWWALNGPVIVGVAQFDRPEAKRLLRRMTLQRLSETFPQYWSSYWSAADQVESSLIPEVGLPDQSLAYASIPVYCAHPHAWIPYCWYRLAE